MTRLASRVTATPSLPAELWVGVNLINETEGHRFSDLEPEATGYTASERGALFKAMQKEWGRCVSAMYVDTPKGTKAVGWVFQSRQEYEDAHRMRRGEERTYIREAWVTVEERVSDDILFNMWVGGTSPTPAEVALFSHLEVGGCRDLYAGEEGEEQGTHYEACDDADATVWTVYGRYTPTPDFAGCEAITDAPSKAMALAIAEHLGQAWGLKVLDR